VEISFVTFAGIAVLYTVLILVMLNLIAYEVGKYRGRREERRQSTQPKAKNFALKEGQTIVGVMDTTKAIYFHIGNDVMDGKNYE
jgi:hypothetical protein